MRYTFLLLAVLLVALPSAATTIVVDAAGGGDYSTVQGGVDAAVTGDTLLVRAGYYEENVIVPGPSLTWIGDGAGLTVISASDPAPAIWLDMELPPGASSFSGFTVQAYALDEVAVGWSEGGASFSDCDLIGSVGGGSAYGAIGLENCTATHAHAGGGDRHSYVEDSSVGSLFISGVLVFGPGGATYWNPSSVSVENSTVGAVQLCAAGLSATQSELGELSTMNEVGGCHLVDCEVGSIDLASVDLDLIRCAVSGGVAMSGWFDHNSAHCGDVVLTETVVQGDIDIHVDSSADNPWLGLDIVHTTIDGGFGFTWSTFWGDFLIWPYCVQSNIFTGTANLPTRPEWYWPVVTHNDFVGEFTVPAGADTVYGNISAEPLFCGVGDYTLEDCSPCVGAAHDGGDIGALGVGCACQTLVEPMSWGAIKARYRQPPN